MRDTRLTRIPLAVPLAVLLELFAAYGQSVNAAEQGTRSEFRRPSKKLHPFRQVRSDRRAEFDYDVPPSS